MRETTSQEDAAARAPTTDAAPSRRLAAPWRWVARAWLACQVEMHGQYSVQRMLTFDAYGRLITARRMLELLFLSFEPGLMMEMALEAIPLGPLRPGRDSTGPPNFWIRTTFGTYIVTHSLVAQYRHNVRGLALSSRQVFALSVATTGLVTPIFFGVSRAVGFPVPFFVVLAMIPWTPIVASICGFLLRHQLRRDPTILPLLTKYTLVFLAQTCLIVVYPAYSYVFNAHPSRQTALALLLPVIKISLKNWFGYASRHNEDLKPELVVFNVEIFSALYVASCMQNTTSIYTTVVIMAVDFVQACQSIKDLNDVLDDRALRAALAVGDNVGRGATSSDLIPLTTCILHANAFVRDHPSIQMRTYTPRAEATIAAVAERSRVVPLRATGWLQSKAHVNAIATATATTSSSAAEAKVGLKRGPTVAHVQQTESPLDSAFSLFALRRASTQPSLPELASRLSDAEQLLVVQRTLQVLHICEFVALVEYAEVFVPIVYSVFSAVAFWFPNRHAFVLLSALTPTQFWRSLYNVVLYGSLELVSFVALDQVMRRKFGISAFAQTAFVLETQWPTVQSKLTLWMIVALQFTHSFYGNDFSFQFEWLQHSAQAAP